MKKSVSTIKKSLKDFTKLLKGLFKKKKRTRRKYFSLEVLRKLQPQMKYAKSVGYIGYKRLTFNSQHSNCSMCKLLGRRD